MKYLRIYNLSIHINFYQNRFINESGRKNFVKFSYRRKDVKTERRKDGKVGIVGMVGMVGMVGINK